MSGKSRLLVLKKNQSLGYLEKLKDRNSAQILKYTKKKFGPVIVDSQRLDYKESAFVSRSDMKHFNDAEWLKCTSSKVKKLA